MDQDDEVYYNGRKVLKKHFRAFVYGTYENGHVKTRLVNSWEEYQDCLSSGIWFKSQEDIEKVDLSLKKSDPLEVDSLLLKNKKRRVKNDS